MSLLKKLFGGGAAAKPPPSQDYKGFKITPNPEKGAGGYRIGALIEKEIDG